MNVRVECFRASPNAAHIFCDALLNPQPHLHEEIRRVMQPFDLLNEHVYRSALRSVTLRENVTMEDALQYFRQMQTMFNGYFSSPACCSAALDEKVRIHENNIPKLFNFMLYGIAKGGNER